MEDDEHGSPPERPDSMLPYDLWTEDALRHVVVTALSFVAEHGLPGEHHFYISFRTDARDVVVPSRLREQYPNEMTIVLQHQYWDLLVDETGFSVGLSFNSVGSTLRIPFAAVTGFADPHVQFGLRFRPPQDVAANDEGGPEAEADATSALDADAEQGGDKAGERDPAETQVVSLDAFRKRSKDS